MRFERIFYLLMMVILLAPPIYSQDSLRHYQQLAGRNNALLMQRFKEFQASAQKVNQVNNLPDPQLEIAYYLEPMEQLEGDRIADFRFMQMFPWFGVIKNNKDEMSWMAKAKFESFRDAKLTLYFNVEKAWYDLYQIRRNSAFAAQSLDLLKTLERISIAKFKSGSLGKTNSPNESASFVKPLTGVSSKGMNNGMGGAVKSTSMTNSANEKMSGNSSSNSIAEVYQLQIEIGDLENSIELLHDNEKVAQSRFNFLLNREASDMVYTSDSLEVSPLELDFLMIDDSIFQDSPMLKMLLNEQQSLLAKYKMQKNMGMPMIGLGFNYSIINNNPMLTSAMNGKDMIMPMMTFTLPIYRGKYKAMKAESNLLREASIQNSQEAIKTLKLEYSEAVQLYNDANRRIKLYKRQRELTQKLLDIQTKNFSVSGANLASVLRIRQQLIDYQSKSIAAEVDFNTAKAWMKRLKSVSEIK